LPDEYKALTVINLPFSERLFRPGEMIPVSAFEESAALAAAAIEDRTGDDEGASPISSAEETIQALIEGGSLSEDPSAELHIDHIPRPTGELSLLSISDNAKALVSQMEGMGQPVPIELRTLADMEIQAVTTNDSGAANDGNPKGGS
jgi:hypothetical protein